MTFPCQLERQGCPSEAPLSNPATNDYRKSLNEYSMQSNLLWERLKLHYVLKVLIYTTS